MEKTVQRTTISFVLSSKCYLNDQIKENKMGAACSTQEEDEKKLKNAGY